MQKKTGATLFEKKILFIINLLLLFILLSPVPGICQHNGSQQVSGKNYNGDTDSLSIKLRKLGFTGIGIDAIAFLKEGYDTGAGVGLRFPRKFYFPYSEVSTSVLYLGASNDSLDINVVGIEESLVFYRTHHKPFLVFMGLTVGYYYSSESEYLVRGSVKDRYPNTSLILGAKYELKAKSIVAQLKYGMRQDLNELRLFLGMNFYE
jgi:hypothetical protein